MILGMSLATFTLLHVLISLVGIASGLVVMYGLLTSKRLDRWTAIFLISTVATSVSDFAFPFHQLLPSHKLAILSLVVLAAASVARYGLHMSGAWRPIYVASASVALYFNVFVLVVQSFEKVPALRALAPAQKEPPFAVTQLLILALFVVLTVLAVMRFRPSSVMAETNAVVPQNQKRAA
jgi:hypothetical protein